MINKDYDNMRNPMLGAFLLWNFVLGYYSKKNKGSPLEELFIVLPMVMREDISKLIRSTNKSSGLIMMVDKFLNTDVLKNDLISNLHNDIKNMQSLTINSLSEAMKVGLISMNVEDNTVLPLELKKRKKESYDVIKMSEDAQKLGQWCSEINLASIEEILKVRF